MPRKCATGPQYGWQPDPHSPDVLRYINEGVDDWKNVKSVKEHDEKSGLKPIQDKNGNVMMHHWSSKKGIETLNPKMQGEMIPGTGQTIGLRNNNFRQGQPAIPSTSFGLNVGHPEGYTKEQGLGDVEYIAEIPFEKIYDLRADPLSLRVERDKIIQEQKISPMDMKSKNDIMSKLIKNKGYAGFFVSNGAGYGLTAAIWEPTLVQEVKNKSEALAKSTASKFSNMLEGWRVTPEQIQNYKDNTPTNKFPQEESLKAMAQRKFNKDPKHNLDTDYEWARGVIIENRINTLGAVQNIPTFREMIAGVGTKIAGKLIRQGGGQGYVRILNGTRVKSRLDIPSYESTDTWVVTVHKPRGSGVIGYAKSAVLNNVEFDTFSGAASRVARGEAKSTFAKMEGDWVDVSASQAEQMANQAIADKQGWVEVGMNPNRYGYFYVKETGEKILTSSKVIQVGPLVMASLEGARIEPTPHSELLADVRDNSSERIIQIAEQYKQRAGIEKPAPQIFKPVNEQFGKRVAMAYEAMKHKPNKPEVAEAYSALINETLEQYKDILNSGFQAEFIPAGQTSPYAQPSQSVRDIVDNNHMWVYSTREGHGEGEQLANNPMLQPTQFIISGQTALVNDIFRVVHDYFGHAKNGVGFRAEGEESAFISHSSMYSDVAVKALASETRGQNSWVNFGPYAKENKTASEESTVYAPQKVGLLPKDLIDPTKPPV